MESKTLKSSVTVSGATMDYTLTDKVAGASEKVSVDLAAVFPGFDTLADLAQRALAFAVRTKLRNGTGGKTMGEAVAVLNETYAQLMSGKWVSATRQGTGETRVSIFIRALAQAMSCEVSDALEAFNAKVEETCRENGIDPEADDEDSGKAVTKVAAAVRKAYLAFPAVEAAYRSIKIAEEQKKADAASAKASDSDGSFSLGTISLSKPE